MTAAEFVLLNNFLRILSDLKYTNSTSRPSPDTDSNWDSDEEVQEMPNWMPLFCFDTEGGDDEGDENEKEESLENFCLFLSKWMGLAKLMLGPDKGESNHQSWMMSSRSNLVKVRIVQMAKLFTLLVEVAAIVWKEAIVKSMGIKEDDIVSISILNMEFSF